MKTFKKLLFIFSVILGMTLSISFIEIKEKNIVTVSNVKYEMVTLSFVGAPKLNKDGVTYTWYINVVSNVIGNTYTEFYHTDTTFFTFTDKDSQDEIKLKAQQTGITYVATHYK